METIKIDKKLAQKVIDAVTPGLCYGLGDPKPGKMCVEAAVNYACGLPHGDDPKCVGRAVRNFKIELNDQKWSSDKARAQGMIKIAIAQLGSNKINQPKFRKLMVEEFKQQLFKKFDKSIKEILKNKQISDVKKISSVRNIVEELYVDHISFDGLTDFNDSFLNIKKDEYYIFLADICLKVLKKMKSPGVKYLYLLNKK